MSETKASLRDYQIADLAFYIANPRGMNLSDAGVGKTPSVCVMQHWLWFEKGIGTVWVQPKGLMAKNRLEILRFTDFQPEDVVIVDGSAKQVEEQLASGAKVFLMGFRRWTLSWRNLPSYVRAVHVDEFHKGFKRVTSSATQALFDAFRTKRMDWFLPMTGTLQSGELDSVYPAIHIAEPRYYASYEDFLQQHAIYDIMDSGKIAGWTNTGKIAAILSKHAIRRTFKDVYGEQEVVYQTSSVEMSPAQREIYDKFEEEAILELEKFMIDGTQPGVGFIRARQIMEHPNHFPDLTEKGKFVDIMPGQLPGKEALLLEHLDDHKTSGMPFLLFSPLRPQQARIIKHLDTLGLKYGVINGSVSMAERQAVNVAFDKGEIQGVLGSPECMDVGYNMQWNGKKETGHVIFMGLDYLDTTILQAVQRAIRGKRETPLRVTVLEYLDSIDQKIAAIVYRKSLLAHEVDPSRPILNLFYKVPSTGA